MLYHITPNEVRERLQSIDHDWNRVYAVPKGGMCAAAYLRNAQLVDEPEIATILLDDIIDSGATRERYANFGKPFFAVVDKQGEDREIGWVVFPWEIEQEQCGPADAIVRLLEFIGEDPKRDGLIETPQRVLKAWKEMTVGYDQNPKEILGKHFDAPCEDMIVLRNIAFYSTCEHHLLPFYGTATVGYLPGRVVGISKLARLVDCYARRLQIQERMTEQIALDIEVFLEALGVGVVLKAHHLCMGCRGVKQPETVMVTSALRGNFRTDGVARAEFLNLANGAA